MTLVRLDKVFELPRPEYAKQAEVIAVDMLWRSLGTSRDGVRLLRSLPDAPAEPGAASRRMVLRRRGRSSTSALVTETQDWALALPPTGRFADVDSRDMIVSALLHSARAPTSGQERSITCSPVHAGLFPYQTVHGAVNKASPADLSQVVEVVARLGGAPEGAAAAMLARALSSPNAVPAHWIDEVFDALGQCAWDKIIEACMRAAPDGQVPEGAEEWPRMAPTSSQVATTQLFTAWDSTPFGWFWTNWARLLAPTQEWREALPDRRFVDWAITLLRTGLAFAYLWEAEFLRRLEALTLGSQAEAEANIVALGSMFSAPVLVRAEPRANPIRNKDLSGWLTGHLAAPFEFRDRIRRARIDVPVLNLTEGPDHAWNVLRPLADAFHAGGQPDDLDGQEEEAQRDPVGATNTTREFVRYLLQARRVGEVGPDEADLYYLARSSGSKFWIEPGPEWLVVVASLEAGRPGGDTTLGALRRNLAKLGLAVDRAALVSLLEETGLTQDSPDADDGLVISASFGRRS